MSTTPLDIKFTQRLPANLISNIIYFVLNIIIGLALVPFFLDTLGTAAYGLIPLATSITSYITLVIDSLNTSISRFLTIDLQRADIKRANETFNTALFGTLGVILLLVPFALAAAWYAPAFFNIGDQSATDVFLLFAFIFASVLIRAWSSNFMVVLFAYNRLDLRNYVNSTNRFTQLVLVLTLFLCLGPSLTLVGLSYAGAAIVTFAMAFILSKRTCPYLKISPASFVRARLREIGGMSTWVLINSVGWLLNTQVALIVVNKLFGEVAGTEYSLAAVWSTLLIGIASLATNLLTPMTYSYYAQQDRKGLIHFTSTTIKVIGLFMALPIGLVCIFSPQLLTIWVGAEFAHLAPLIWICVAPVILQIMSSCITPITLAYNRVRSLVILTLPLSFLNVILALHLPYIFDIGMYGVALAGLITLSVRYGVIQPLFIAYVIQIPTFTYLKKMTYGIGGLLVLSVAGIALLSVVTISTLPTLILAGSGIAAAYLLFVLNFVLNPEEREMIRSCLPEVCQKRIPSWLL
ncbi:MAG: lipopolysaccharide biosynthesis protein [Candidatus Methanoculleus thermohydrogenotrophicum]|jgi:membrane protein EpsK